MAEVGPGSILANASSFGEPSEVILAELGILVELGEANWVVWVRWQNLGNQKTVGQMRWRDWAGGGLRWSCLFGATGIG